MILDIYASNMRANDTEADGIGTRNTNYCLVCAAYQNIKWNLIKGAKEKSKHFLDGKIRGDQRW